MTRKTLLTPRDVVKFAGVDVNITTCTFREIYNVEFNEARKCIGYEFWKVMVAALADYSAKPDYVAGASYLTDDIVNYQGTYRIALSDTSAVPSVSTDWSNAPRFTGDCAESYDALFCDFLGPYLANKVLADRLPFIWVKIKDTGLIGINDNQYETVDSNAYTRTLTAIHANAKRAWGNLEFFMDETVNEDNTCFALWPGYETTTDCGCGLSTCKTCGNAKRPVGSYGFG